jgi:hypothetical protein
MGQHAGGGTDELAALAARRTRRSMDRRIQQDDWLVDGVGRRTAVREAVSPMGLAASAAPGAPLPGAACGQNGGAGWP